MDAIQITRFDGSKALEYAQLPVPQPKSNEVLIRVAYAGVNFADLHRSKNEYLQASQLPFTPGAEVVGVRVDTGERVLAYCGTGGYAEYVVAPERLVFPIRADISDQTVLALFVQGVTAWFLLAKTARIQPDDCVVIHSAAGGTGSLLLTLAKQLFLVKRVIGTSTSEEKLDQIKKLGADTVVETAETKDLSARLIAENNGNKVDVVFDAIGGEIFAESFAALAPFGRMVVYGLSSRQPNTLRTSWLLRGTQTVSGFWFHSLLADQAGAKHIQQGLEQLFQLASDGRIDPHIGGIYALQNVARAHEDLAARKTMGKLMVKVDAI